MNSRNTALRRYYRRIGSYSPCSGKMKKQILTEIRANVTGYLAEFPEAEFKQIEARFGSPEVIAAGYLSDMSENELLESLNISQKLFRITVCTFVLVVLMWVSIVVISFVHAQNSIYPGSDQAIAQQEAIQSQAGE